MMTKTFVFVLLGCSAVLAYPSFDAATTTESQQETTTNVAEIETTTEQLTTESQGVTEFYRRRRHITEEPEVVKEELVVVSVQNDGVPQIQTFTMVMEDAEPVTTTINPTTEEIDFTTTHSRHVREVETTEIPTTTETFETAATTESQSDMTTVFVTVPYDDYNPVY